MSEPNLTPRTQRYLDILDSVLDIAHDVLKDLHQQSATPAEPGAAKPDHTIPIDRIARTIRRTVLLALKVAEPPKPERSTPKPSRTEARKRIIREVEDHINRTIDDDDEAKILQADLLDRLDSPELEDEIDARPIPDIITDIVRDLGLDSDWGANRFKRRFQPEIAALAALAAEPLPAEPTPLRNTTPAPRIKAPSLDHLTPAQAVAAVLQYGRTRDG